MCTICILIDQSIPSPKSLMSALKETGQEDTPHGADIFDRVLDKLPNDEERYQYVRDILGDVFSNE